MPQTALLARFGADEFVVGLPNTRIDDAFTLAEEFRRRVAALRLEEWPAMRITCTIGLAGFPTHGKRLPELLREADQALYVAKLGGRNKVALPLAEGRMITKTSYYTATQLERLALLARRVDRNEASLLREALDDVLKKYNDLLSAPPAPEAAPAPDAPGTPA
jgi:predicted signal transduction protein with EAL and GGDEF domain